MSTEIKDEAQSILMAHNSYMNPLVMIEAKEKMQEDPELQQRIIEQFTYLKKPNTALMLSFFGGMLGLDRLYLSQPVIFIFKLGTVGLFGAWWFLDLFLIKKSTRKVNDIKVKYIIADILPVNPIIQRFKIAMKESKAASNKSKEAWNKMKDDLAENKKAIKADWNKLKEDIAENTKTLKAELAETDAEHEVKKDEIEAEHKAKLEQAKKEKALAEKPLTDPNPYRGNWKTSIFKSQGNNYKAIQMKTLEYVYDQVLEKVVPNMAAGKEIDRWFLPDVRELDDISKINTAFQSLNSHESIKDFRSNEKILHFLAKEEVPKLYSEIKSIIKEEIDAAYEASRDIEPAKKDALINILRTKSNLFTFFFSYFSTKYLSLDEINDLQNKLKSPHLIGTLKDHKTYRFYADFYKSTTDPNFLHNLNWLMHLHVCDYITKKPNFFQNGVPNQQILNYYNKVFDCNFNNVHPKCISIENAKRDREKREAQEARRKQEIERQRQEREALIAKYPEFESQIKDKEFAIDMPYELATIIFGAPADKKTDQTKTRKSETCFYGKYETKRGTVKYKYKIRFTNGLIDSINEL